VLVKVPRPRRTRAYVAGILHYHSLVSLPITLLVRIETLHKLYSVSVCMTLAGSMCYGFNNYSWNVCCGFPSSTADANDAIKRYELVASVCFVVLRAADWQLSAIFISIVSNARMLLLFILCSTHRTTCILFVLCSVYFNHSFDNTWVAVRNVFCTSMPAAFSETCK